MSKTVTIPSYKNPFDVEINGVKYSYKAGATVSVPDEVAALIEANAKNAPQENDPTIRLVTEIGENPTDKEVATAKATAEAIEEAVEEAVTIPTITIDLTQIVSADPIVIQLTAEQVDIFKSDATAINVVTPLSDRASTLFISDDPSYRSSIPRTDSDLDTIYTIVYVDNYGNGYVNTLIISSAKDRYNLSYTLYNQMFLEHVYGSIHGFANNAAYQMPNLRVNDSLDGSGSYNLAFHCSSITPITDGYHCVFVHDEYDAEESKMAYTVFSFDVDSSNAVTNQLYNRYYA